MSLKNIISKIEATRKSKVIVYFTSDRQNLLDMISEDIIEVFYNILVKLKPQKQIDLIIYSRGGATIVPLPLVKLIRKFCDKFCVLVPFRAHSAATMIALGADEIYMTKLAELGPIDAQQGFIKQNGHIRVSVVDVFAYLEFTKKHLGIDYKDTNDGLEILKNFHQFSNLTPNDLAVLYRIYNQSFEYAKQLAELSYKDEKLVNKLCGYLITSYGSHDYKIDSIEAAKIGLNIAESNDEFDILLHEVYVVIEKLMNLKIPFIVTGNSTDQKGILSLISSKNICYTKECAVVLDISPQANGQQPGARMDLKGWEVNNEYLR